MSKNAQELKSCIGLFSPGESVNSIAKTMGWGWHRTKNTLKEIGCGA